MSVHLALIALCLVPLASIAMEPSAPAEPWRLLFSGERDLVNPWGGIHIAVTPVRLIREVPDPGFTVVANFPLADGSWEVFGQTVHEIEQLPSTYQRTMEWKLVRAITRDGVTFEQQRVVFEPKPGPWTDHLVIARHGETGDYLMLKLKMNKGGFAYTAFTSRDGVRWKEQEGNPLFHDGDAMSLFWSPALKRFVCINKGLEPYPKRIRDHGGNTPALGDESLRDRRVLMMRTSPDGRKWEPDVSITDVWNIDGKKAAIPSAYMTVPDSQDPPDLEFYSGNGFWYHDRAYMMVLNYAATPTMPGKHAPHLDNEWWTSYDGLRWERPARGVNALEPFPGLARLETGPMVIGGNLVFLRGTRLMGLPVDRISGAAARANAEFTTRPFTMPAGGLLLNAAIPDPARPFATQQAYVMAAVLDDKGAVVAGYEPEKCVLTGVDHPAIALKWGEATGSELAGKRVRLRFYLRSAVIYAVTAGK